MSGLILKNYSLRPDLWFEKEEDRIFVIMLNG